MLKRVMDSLNVMMDKGMCSYTFQQSSKKVSRRSKKVKVSSSILLKVIGDHKLPM